MPLSKTASVSQKRAADFEKEYVNSLFGVGFKHTGVFLIFRKLAETDRQKVKAWLQESFR